ncbi:ATP-binding protein [Tenacibaculum discolor]|uniref:ATP-binding protein n=1 Tax=Tenacibaculum discolor TaxID=361581 RepID=UPI000EB1C583|nr:ATP-binding protein [Tenacibaculum discolor]RLK06569.1 putative AbiEii toxin of type IV toxin-antitoxin system [Tenacibaculum discolor]
MSLKVNISQKHKSVEPPCSFELPVFSVLTGKNGSGKTHLLEAMANKQKSTVEVNGSTTQNIRYIPFNGLNPKIQENCDPNTISQHIKDVWTRFTGHLQNAKRRNRNNIGEINRLFNDVNATNFLNKTIKDSGKNYEELTEDDFADSFDISFMGQNDFFTAQFALIFKNYHKRQEENNINEYYQSKGKPITKPVLTEEEFIKKYGEPPWDFVNKILDETTIPYQVNNPLNDRLDSSFTFKLKDKVHGFEISSADLSTGEKVLMSLALAIYNTGGDLGKPDVLLIDEPDAGLHPSMSKMMVRILKENIVEQNKIPTVISTHSPTTVISSEGLSIYQLIRGNNSPTKIPVQEAVEILSSDIPFLRISTEKRRQVFVESKYDVTYYELLMNIYGRLVSFASEPIFIPARTSNGSNCTDVIEVVKNLYSNGNDQIYGIIDWDLSNTSADRIIVLGKNDRYAIENYLLDPLLMGLLTIRENKIPITDFTGLSISTYSQVISLTQSDAQIIIDKVLNDLNLQSANRIKYKTFNGWELEITKEFNQHQGHDLETLYKSKFPFLNSYQREDALKKDVIEKVINDHPNYAPIELSDIIMKIK